jgi:cardiolipin synthase
MVMAAAVCGCASVPEAPIIATPVDEPAILGADNARLSPEATRSMFVVAGGGRRDGMLQELARVVEGISHEPLVAGNAVSPLVDGPATFRAMFEAITAARHHIHMETFILEDDDIGRELAERLIERRRAGVEVRLIYDAFGSRNVSEIYIQRLQEAGIDLYEYNPLDLAEDLRIWRINNRNHRKLLIVDGEVAFTGGINISEVYAESSLSISRRRDAGAADKGWRDTHARIAGPIVHRLQRGFLGLWQEYRPDEDFDATQYFPPLTPQGDLLVRAVASRGGDDEFAIYTVFLAAIAHARERIWITQAYFAPDDTFLETLREAAHRGVDVRLLLPGLSDAPLVIQASRADYESLLEAGIRIYEHSVTTLHAKTVVIDGVWSSIGSTNFDYRSFLHNHELNLIVVSREFGRTMEEIFEADLRQVEEITLSTWRRRALLQRIKETLGSALRYWF